MDWQSYEELVKDIYEQIGKSSGVEILGWGRSCKVQGKSKAKHQIDVLTSHTDGLHTYRTAIECKCWNKKVSKDAIAKLSDTIEDAKIDKGVIVSKSGFTRDAELVAQSNNIALVVLRKPVDEDWDGYIREINIHLNFLRHEVYDLKVVKDPPTDKSRKKQWRGQASDIVLDMPDGYSERLDEMVNKVVNSVQPVHETHDVEHYSWSKTSSQEDGVSEYNVKFPDDTCLSIPFEDSRMKILEVRFKVRYLIHTEKIGINAMDHVAWILHEIFGDKKLALDMDGTMREFD